MELMGSLRLSRWFVGNDSARLAYAVSHVTQVSRSCKHTFDSFPQAARVGLSESLLFPAPESNSPVSVNLSFHPIGIQIGSFSQYPLIHISFDIFSQEVRPPELSSFFIVE